MKDAILQNRETGTVLYHCIHENIVFIYDNFHPLEKEEIPDTNPDLTLYKEENPYLFMALEALQELAKNSREDCPTEKTLLDVNIQISKATLLLLQGLEKKNILNNPDINKALILLCKIQKDLSNDPKMDEMFERLFGDIYEKGDLDK